MTRSESPARRLHPLYLVFTLASSARNLILPGLIAIFAARKSESWEAWVMILFFPAAIAAVAKYVSFRYRLDDDELVVSGGVLTRFERHVPYDRIQNINLVQNVVHRIFGIGAIRIETASGEEPEASMEALSLDAIREIRACSRAGGAAAAAGREQGEDGAGEAPSPTLLRLDAREIAVAGIISNRGSAVVAAALGVLWNLDFALDEYFEELGKRVQTEQPGTPEIPVAAAVALGAAVVLALVVLMRLLSIAWMIVELYGFRLRRSDGDLELEYGLLTRIRATIPLRRVQHVSWRQSLLHRVFGRVEGTAVTAGDAATQASSPRRARLAPILRADRHDDLMREILPECVLEGMEWRGIPKRARARVFLPRAILLAAGCSVLAVWMREWAAVVFAGAAILLFVHARRWVATLRWAVSPETVACRSGWPGRRTTVVRRRKIQSVSMTRSPFDRRRRMATVSVDTAGGSAFSGSLAVRHLDLEDAEWLAEALRVDTARRAFEW